MENFVDKMLLLDDGSNLFNQREENRIKSMSCNAGT